MPSRTVFRFESGDVGFELSGSEEFVRRNLQFLMPFVDRVAGKAAQGAPAEPPSEGAPPRDDDHDLKSWYQRHAPKGGRLSMQDHILVFALWMRTFKKYIFTSEDIRRAFEELEMQEPKSLLQILGTLKRDHNLILGTERRGEYMLNTTGIERARRVLGMPVPRGREESPPAQDSGSAASEGAGESAARAVMDI